MEINTNPNSIVPLYAQIVESLKRDIENGVYNATERIPAGTVSLMKIMSTSYQRKN